ncbi:hypothetical protein QVD17_16019 [Tagetes erecta]|uniref:Uncharacterized protein n=1 Tax=Tagetes erecta TaxID=13708 RepID=A0AAD8P065_TARER|nr:hypothetical protein QVD17_16019 [Tagetes erecta]
MNVMWVWGAGTGAGSPYPCGNTAAAPTGRRAGRGKAVVVFAGGDGGADGGAGGGGDESGGRQEEGRRGYMYTISYRVVYRYTRRIRILPGN